MTTFFKCKGGKHACLPPPTGGAAGAKPNRAEVDVGCPLQAQDSPPCCLSPRSPLLAVSLLCLPASPAAVGAKTPHCQCLQCCQVGKQHITMAMHSPWAQASCSCQPHAPCPIQLHLPPAPAAAFPPPAPLLAAWKNHWMPGKLSRTPVAAAGAEAALPRSAGQAGALPYTRVGVR